jgi:hypothetical protein
MKLQCYLPFLCAVDGEMRGGPNLTCLHVAVVGPNNISSTRFECLHPARIAPVDFQCWRIYTYILFHHFVLEEWRLMAPSRLPNYKVYIHDDTQPRLKQTKRAGVTILLLVLLDTQAHVYSNSYNHKLKKTLPCLLYRNISYLLIWM